MTGLVAVTLAGVAALPLYPMLRDRVVIHNLHSQDQAQRELAFRQALGLATQTDNLSVARGFLSRLEPHLLADLGSTDQSIREQAVRIGIAICADARPPRQPSPVAKAFARRLEAALDGADDARFMGLAGVLRSLGRLHEPLRTPVQMDRYGALTLASSQHAAHPEAGVSFRQGIANELIGCDRDNKYVRQAMEALVTDPAPELRCYGSILAAKLGDDAALSKLLEDQSTEVQECAAIDAGMAGRKGMGEAILQFMGECDGSPDLIGSCAYALACMDRQKYSAEICEHWAALCALSDDDYPVHPYPVRCDRFGYVVAFLNVEDARNYSCLFGHDGDDQPMTLYLAGKLRVQKAVPAVKATLAEAIRPGSTVTQRQLLATLGAAYEFRLPCRKEARDICERLWGPDRGLMLLAAVKLLEQQATLPQPEQTDVPTLKECFSTLYKAAVFTAEMPTSAPATSSATSLPFDKLRASPLQAPSTAPATQEAPATLPTTLPATRESLEEDSGPRVVTTPVPSAAAAMALWRLGAPMGEQFLRDTVESSGWLPGEYVAWHLAMDRVAGVPPARRADVSSAQKTTGAPNNGVTMALGELAGETPATQEGVGETPATRSVTRPATQGAAPTADPFSLGLLMLPALDCPPKLRVYSEQEKAAGAMLLALSAGNDDQRRVALERIGSRRAGGKGGPERNFYLRGAYDCASLILGDRSFLPRVREKLGTSFPERRCMTALLAAGDKGALDWLLLNPQLTEEDIRQKLVGETIYEVLEAAVPELPRITPCGSKELMQWQVRLMIHYYAIHHAEIVPSLTARTLPTSSPSTLPATGPAK